MAVALALTLRLYPTVISGQPFSTDAWPLIRNTELIIEHTPIQLGETELLDDYNSYWPASSLFGAVLSHVTGLKPINAMEFGIPLSGALTILVFYALVYEYTRDAKQTFFASILLAASFPYALLTAGVTKETFANPLYMLCILIFLREWVWRKNLLFIIASVALVLSHHLTVFVTLAILASIALASMINRVREGLAADKSRFLLVFILTTVTVLYFGLYAGRGLNLSTSFSDWLSVASYQIVAFALALLFTLRPYKYSRTRTILACSSILALVTLFAFLCTRISIIPGAPRLPSHYMLYASPFILTSPLIVLGLGTLLGHRMGGKHSISTVFWLAITIGLEGYAVFGRSPIGLTLAYRTLNFLCIPSIVLCAAGLRQLYGKTSSLYKQRLVRLTAVITLIIIATLNSYNIYATVSLGERYMGYFWLYSIQEVKAATWIKNTGQEQTVTGDVKIFYLLNGYFNVKVDVFQGLYYIMGKERSKPDILFFYDKMLTNGYVLYGGYSVDLPEKWTEKLLNLNLIYSNGLVKVHAG